MFAYLKGKIIEKNLSNESLILEVNNIGYLIFSNTRTLANLMNGQEIIIHTYMRSNDDGIKLWGLSSKAEKEMFELLISVSGLGPKSALNILNLLKVEDIISAINREDHKIISKAQGIGDKTSKKLILELKNKIKKISGVVNTENQSEPVFMDELRSILENLGFNTYDIEEKIREGAQANLANDLELWINFCLKNKSNTSLQH